MVLLSPPVTIDRLAPGPPRTTHAGRFAVPVALMDGERELAVISLVFDDAAAEQLHQALENHLAGRGSPGHGTAPAAAQTPARSRAERP